MCVHFPIAMARFWLHFNEQKKTSVPRNSLWIKVYFVAVDRDHFLIARTKTGLPFRIEGKEHEIEMYNWYIERITALRPYIANKMGSQTSSLYSLH